MHGAARGHRLGAVCRPARQPGVRRCRRSLLLPPSPLTPADEEAPLAERREGLEDYGFACACAKCEAEELAEQLGVL